MWENFIHVLIICKFLRFTFKKVADVSLYSVADVSSSVCVQYTQWILNIQHESRIINEFFVYIIDYYLNAIYTRLYT